MNNYICTLVEKDGDEKDGFCLSLTIREMKGTKEVKIPKEQRDYIKSVLLEAIEIRLKSYCSVLKAIQAP